MSHVIWGKSISRYVHKLSLAFKRSAGLPAIVLLFVLHMCVPGEEMIYSKPE